MHNTKYKSANAKVCPTCGAPAMRASHPFCSKRCANVDLGRWFRGAYAVPDVDSTDGSVIDTDFAASAKLFVSEPGEGHG